MTFHHHVEEMMSVPYRYMKNFTGDYIDLDGNKLEKTYSIYVRNLNEKVQTELEPIGKKLSKVTKKTLTSFQRFHQKVLELIDKNVPRIMLTKKQKKREHKPWITKEIKKMINTRDKMFHKFQKEKSPLLRCNLFQKYKDLKIMMDFLFQFCRIK